MNSYFRDDLVAPGFNVALDRCQLDVCLSKQFVCARLILPAYTGPNNVRGKQMLPNSGSTPRP